MHIYQGGILCMWGVGTTTYSQICISPSLRFYILLFVPLLHPFHHLAVLSFSWAPLLVLAGGGVSFCFSTTIILVSSAFWVPLISFTASSILLSVRLFSLVGWLVCSFIFCYFFCLATSEYSLFFWACTYIHCSPLSHLLDL